MKLSFHGADRDVTGSCHMLECAGKKILIDCGLFQGSHELNQDNATEFGFDAASIDYVLLTHAHLDHCGRLPLLVKRGFQGEIICTAATRELARVVLLDAAHLQEEDAQRNTRRARRQNRKSEADEPLYSLLDAMNCFECFGRKAHYSKAIELAPGLTATYYDAGHILGSASIRIEYKAKDTLKSITFSGDLGNSGRPLLRDPVPPPHSDVVVMETTYGDRLHRSLPDSVNELYEAISGAFQRGGNVIIPTFALERAQEILFYLREGVQQGKLAGAMQVFLDSPMAISATEVFIRHPECFDEQATTLLRNGQDLFAVPGLHLIRDTSESMAINRFSGAVIMAGSGMCTGGRVRHHLKHNLWRSDSTIIFVGYAAAGTLARRIIDGARFITLFGEEIPVQARIYTINGFSAHADRDELLTWHKAIAPVKTFLVHGDEQVMQSFQKRLKGQVELPRRNEVFEL
jgi:metallo-beta-lactamase family protein